MNKDNTMDDILRNYITLLAEQEAARAALKKAEVDILLFLRLHETPKEPNERLYMEGKYSPVCWVCKQTIPKGTPVYWNPDRSTPDRCRVATTGSAG